MAAHQALEALIDAMPPARTLDILRLKLPSADAVHRCGVQAGGSGFGRRQRIWEGAAAAGGPL